jgi:hypothetical protein
MWIWLSELHRIGFRRRSSCYWQCERRYELPASNYLSIFVDSSEIDPAGRERIDFASFHVTFRLGADRVHFYYHEVGDNVWEPGGHTSSHELRLHDVNPAAHRELADQIANRLVAAMGGEFVPRSGCDLRSEVPE